MAMGTFGRIDPVRPAFSGRLAKRLARTPVWAMWLLAVGGIVLVGVADYATGSELSVSIFYLVPVALVAWLSPVGIALFVSGIAAAVWLIADLASAEYAHSAIPFWNAGVRLGFFAIVSLLLIRVRRALLTERELSTVDQLTGVSNGRTFRAALEGEVARARRYRRPLTVGYVDLDDFKAINDRFGHHAGDEVLRAVAGALRSHLRATDVVGRLGGDEFAVLLPEAGRASAEAALTKVLGGLSTVASPGGGSVRASIGAVVCAEVPASADDILRAADGAMYRAKADGGHRVTLEVRERAEPPHPAVGPSL